MNTAICQNCGAVPDTRTAVERARDEYAMIAGSLSYHQTVACRDIAWEIPTKCCPVCAIFGQYADATSIALDLAVAVECQERARRSVAYA